MSKSTNLDSTTAKLFSASCDDDLTDEDRKALVSMLDDDAALDDYLDFVLMHAELRQSGRARHCVQSAMEVALQERPEQERSATSNQPVSHAPRDEQPQPAELAREEGKGGSVEDTPDSARGACPTPRSKSWLDRASRRPVRPALAIAALVMISVVAWMGVTSVKNQVAGGGKSTDELQERTKPEFVAWLMAAHETQWLDGTEPEHTRLMPGQRLAIAKGMIEIQYRTRAVVVIEGPAEFYVGARDSGLGAKEKKSRSSAPSPQPPDPKSAANSGFLALGKLVARVEGEDAKGFVIATPTAEVEDLGTEFGVEVDQTGESTVLVYDGKIRIWHANETVRVLTTGQATYVAHESFGDVDVVFEDTHFIRRILPTRIDLAHVVAGRDGTSETPSPRSDVVPFLEEQQFAHAKVNRYSSVRTNPVVDGVFIPDGGAVTEIVVSTTGVTARGIADSSGTTYGYIRSGPNERVLDVTLDGYDYLTGTRSFIGMHANKGITFDLKAVRRMFPETRIERFVAGAGNARGSVDFFVLLDGKVVFQSLGHVGKPDSLQVNIEIAQTVRFLTLIATDAGDNVHEDWAVFTQPTLRLASKPNPAAASDGAEQVEPSSHLERQDEQRSSTTDP